MPCKNKNDKTSTLATEFTEVLFTTVAISAFTAAEIVEYFSLYGLIPNV